MFTIYSSLIGLAFSVSRVRSLMGTHPTYRYLLHPIVNSVITSHPFILSLVPCFCDFHSTVRPQLCFPAIFKFLISLCDTIVIIPCAFLLPIYITSLLPPALLCLCYKAQELVRLWQQKQAISEKKHGCKLPVAHSPMRPNVVCGLPEIKYTRAPQTVHNTPVLNI